MSRLPDHLLDDIRSRIDLRTYLSGEGLKLKPAGSSWRSGCPFEGEAGTGSKFAVFSDHYFCHSCRSRGDIFTWLRERQGLSFRDAVERAADAAGMDVSHALRAARARTMSPEDVRRAAAESCLAAIAEYSASGAARMSPEDAAGSLSAQLSEYLSVRDNAQGATDLPAIPHGSITALIKAGDIGFIPDWPGLVAHLDRLGVKNAAREDVGLEQASELGGKWIFWARKGTRVIGTRPAGSPRPVVGVRGPATSGWVGETLPTSGSGVRGRGPLALASSDELFILLRASGVPGVVRPITRNTLRRRPLPAMTAPFEPPVVLLEPGDNALRRFLSQSEMYLQLHPRLRVAELSLTAGSEAADVSVAAERAIARAGTVIDWYIQKAGERGALSEEPGRAMAARRMARLVLALEQDSLERAAYQHEVESITGIPWQEIQVRTYPRAKTAASRRVPSRRR